MATTAKRTDTAVERLDVAVYTVPTDGPESDGTLDWDSTTIVVVEVATGGERGIGYTYADASAAQLIDRRLRKVVEGADAMAVGGVWEAMIAGRPGIAASAISAVDAALWDLKARLLDLPLVRLLGAVTRSRTRVRQRRVHVIRARRAARATRGLGLGRDRTREDEGRPQTGRGPRARASGAQGDRPRS